MNTNTSHLASGYAALEVSRPEYICKPIIPRGRIVLLVANSTHGKTPFGYQMARDLAAGNAVLDYFACERPSRVGIVDSESAVEDVTLRLDMQRKRPADYGNRLLIWDRQQTYLNHLDLGPVGRDHLLAIVRDKHLDVLLLDNLFALSDGVDVSKASLLQPILGGLRRITDLPHRPSVVVYHHPRKGGREDRRPSILDSDFMHWLEEASGSFLLVNLSDVRLGLERLEVRGEERTVLRGRSRVPGEEQDIGPLYLSVDEGHSLAEIDRSPEVLDNVGEKQATVINCLCQMGRFTTEEAMRAAGKLGVSKKTVQRALLFAREHAFVTDAGQGVWQWRS